MDITFEAEINKVTVKPVFKSGLSFRLCKLVLAREFDSLLASALKGDARKALKALEEGGLSEVTIPIDRLAATGTFKTALSPYPEVTIPDLRGVRCKAKAGRNDEPATVKLEFVFDWSEAAWVFLGRNSLARSEVTIKSRQVEMEFQVGRTGRAET